MSQKSNPTRNPHLSISTEDLTIIVNSPEKLKHWNDLNEQALINQPDEQVIKNIRATAALMVLKEKNVSSQNFELMRAMNLFDRTISATELAKGALTGTSTAITNTIKDKLTAPEPESMNLKHAQARANAAVESPKLLASNIYSAVNLSWQNPSLVTTAIQQAANSGIDNAKSHLASTMQADNASYAIGIVMGAGITNISVNMLDPAKKMNWGEYAKLLGDGTIPPPLKPFRDFSGKMAHSNAASGEHIVTYKPNPRHYIAAEIDKELNLSFGIETRVNPYFNGSGTDLFLSTVKVFHQKGGSATKLSDYWEPGRWSTNYNQFVTALQNGYTFESAAKQTFTGKMASYLGLTSVDTSQLEKAVARSDFSLFEPVFSHPDWGAGEQMNNYAHKFALAHGRPALDVTPLANSVKPSTKSPSAMNMDLLSTLNSLPEHQQQTVFQQMKERLSPSEAILNKDIEPK